MIACKLTVAIALFCTMSLCAPAPAPAVRTRRETGSASNTGDHKTALKTGLRILDDAMVKLSQLAWSYHSW